MIALDRYAEELLIDQSRAQREALAELERNLTMPLTKSFMAAGKGGNRTGDTPRKAALAFFETFGARQCRVTEGELLGGLFIAPMRGQHWPEVTRKTALDLPDSVEA